MTPPPLIRLVIVDDHQLFRTGVRAEMAAHFEVVGEADDAPSAVAIIVELRPDVVLLDVHLPGGGVTIPPAVHALAPDVRFLALSVSDAPDDVIAVIRAGARGYVTKSIAPGDLIDAIHRVHAGDAVFSPRLAGFVLDAFATTSAPVANDELDRLSPRELEVMKLIARGYTYREVAARLYVSVKTIETHVSAVLRKLQLSSRHELSAWAATRDLLSSETPEPKRAPPIR